MGARRSPSYITATRRDPTLLIRTHNKEGSVAVPWACRSIASENLPYVHLPGLLQVTRTLQSRPIPAALTRIWIAAEMHSESHFTLRDVRAWSECTITPAPQGVLFTNSPRYHGEVSFFHK